MTRMDLDEPADRPCVAGAKGLAHLIGRAGRGRCMFIGDVIWLVAIWVIPVAFYILLERS